MKVIDLTQMISDDMPVFPGTAPASLEVVNTYETDGFRETLFRMTSHTGTHMDAPYHLFPERTKLDEMAAAQFVGKALVIDCSDLKAGDQITLDRVTRYGELAKQADFLLFYTGWDRFWGNEEYFGEYPYPEESVIDYVLAGDYKGIGFDVIGLDPIGSLHLHKKLFASAEIINIENLTNLGLCGTELFDFVCLPLKFVNSDGASARAVACL